MMRVFFNIGIPHTVYRDWEEWVLKRHQAGHLALAPLPGESSHAIGGGTWMCRHSDVEVANARDN